MIGSEGEKFRTFLKSKLKDLNIKYEQLAESLGVSLVTVKRILNSEDISLERLFTICKIMKMDVADLFDQYSKFSMERGQLSEEQEKVLSDKPALLYLWVLLVTREGLDEVFKEYNVAEEEFRLQLRELASCGLISLTGESELKIKVYGPIKMNPKGDLYKKVKIFFIEELKNFDSWTLPGNHRETDSIFESFEMYLKDEQRAEFCNEISEVVTKYKRIARFESNYESFPNIKPVSGLIHIEQRDIWKQVYLKRLHPSASGSDKGVNNFSNNTHLPGVQASKK